MVAAVTLRPPWCPAHGAAAYNNQPTCCVDKSMLLKLKNIYLLLLYTSYIKARRIVDAPLMRRACVFGFTMIFSHQPKWLNLIYGHWGGI
jgi:hypothetical protein